MSSLINLTSKGYSCHYTHTSSDNLSSKSIGLTMASPANTSNRSDPVSCKTFHIAGILTDAYGLDELSAPSTSISCLWLLHPRLQTRQWNANVACNAVNCWNETPENERQVGLIAVSFDSRNHGTREVSSKANETWKEGNEVSSSMLYESFC